MKVAIMGFGTVGSGVWKVLKENREIIARRVSEPVEIAYVLDLRDFPGEPVQDVLVKDISVILEDPSVDVVVECMGGLHPAYEFVKRVLEHGKSVATSNKELVAEKGAELTGLAGSHQVDFYYEASVGGGIPVIRALRQSLSPEYILEIQAILNGTTNFILSRMEEGELSYSEALMEAQKLGYAEKNPEADVKGLDACRKLAILSSLAYGATVCPSQIPTEGIERIRREDIERARSMGKKLRLVAQAHKEGDRVFARVSPVMLDPSHPLSSVVGVYNGIWIRGNMIDDILLTGKGAGREATASAVVSDVIAALKNRRLGICEEALWEDRLLMVDQDVEKSRLPEFDPEHKIQ